MWKFGFESVRRFRQAEIPRKPFPVSWSLMVDRRLCAQKKTPFWGFMAKKVRDERKYEFSWWVINYSMEMENSSRSWLTSLWSSFFLVRISHVEIHFHCLCSHNTESILFGVGIGRTWWMRIWEVFYAYNRGMSERKDESSVAFATRILPTNTYAAHVRLSCSTLNFHTWWLVDEWNLLNIWFFIISSHYLLPLVSFQKFILLKFERFLFLLSKLKVNIPCAIFSHSWLRIV